MNLLRKALALTGLLMAGTVCTLNAQTTDKAVACPNTNGLSTQEISEVLAVHNKARSDVNLPPLKWDCKLADYAGEWAARGIFEHRTLRNYGESLFVSGAVAVAPSGGVLQWLKEKAFWDNTTAVCQTGKFCVHYTQIVWKATTRVGCAINRNAAGKWKVLFVCNYDPMGNYPGPAY